MFRNIPLQRSVASIVLASFVSSLLSPLAMAQGTVTAAPSVADSNNSVLLPLGPRKLPSSKGMAVTLSTATAATAANTKASLLAPAPVASNSTSTASADYARALTRLIDLSTQASALSPANSAAAQSIITGIRSQYQILQQQQQLLSKAFTATESFLTQNKLSGTVLQRHQSMVSEFTARAKQLQDAYTPLDNAAAGKGDATAALKQWQQAIKQYASQTSALNGTKLPWGNASDQVRKTTAGAIAPQSNQLASVTGTSTNASTNTSRQSPPPAFAPAPAAAATGSLSGLALPDTVLTDTPVAADLAAAEEIQQSADIRSLAAALQNNPVAIYNYVRNNIQYKAGYGSLQGAAQTLQARSGNDIDTASLLIALNRAAGIPSRYVYGTVEVPAQRLLNWLHVDNISAAQSLLNQAGVPNKAILQGGQTTAIQVEHVWVEAYVDASPSRGAKNNSASAWLPLDPSFKQLTSQTALNLRSTVSLNEAGVFDTAKQGANCTPDYGQSLNQANIQSAFTTYQNQLNQVLNQQGTDLTIGSVLGSNVISAENYAILMGSLPYKTIVKSASFQALPTNLKGAVRLQLFANSAAQAQGTATVSVNSSYAALAGKRLTLSFSPATQADADVMAAYLPKAHADNSPVTAAEYPQSIPGYLIQVKAELRLDGQIIASGGSFTLGSELAASIGSFEPANGNWNDNNFSVHAGDYHAIVADTQGINPAQLNAVQQRLAATQARLSSQPGQSNGVTRDELTGDLLHQTILAYFATTDANSAIFQRAAGVVEQRLPSIGRAVAQAIPDMTLGLVGNVSFPGVALDIDRLQTAVAKQTDGLTPAAYTRQSNQRNVAYAHMVLEKHYSQTQNPTAAASPIRVLAKAAALPQAQQQSVYAVTNSNLAAALLKLNLSNSQSIDVQNAVAAGYRVLVPVSPQTMSGWTGQAMQIEDPQTGAGAYRLSGNNGNTTAAILSTAGMAWLIAEPSLAAGSLTPAVNAAKAYDTILASMLPGGTGGDNTDNVRWSYFSGQTDVASGLFLARLTGAQSSSTCDKLSAIIAANLGTTTAFDGDPGDIASVPVITSAPVTAAVAGLAYRYPVAAQDPKGATLTYSLTDAPSGMSISSTGVISWSSPVLGSVNVTVRADNGKAYAEQRYLLSVSEHALALSISMAVAPALVNIGDQVTVTVLTNGGTGNIATSLTIDGQPQTLDAQGTATINATATGAHQVVATAKDDLGTVSKTSLYSVRNAADSSTPVAQITSPTDDVEITAPVTVTGSATAQNLAYYQLLMRAAGTDKWQELARGYQNISNGSLGKFDPTQLQNGIYELSLITVNTNGVQASHMITLDVTRNLKIGQFSISFEDLNVQASGIPIRITRTYDTRRKAQALDFGQGWSVDYQNVQIRKNIILGLEWDVVTIPSQFTTCLRPRGKRKVDVTLPTGDVARFEAHNEQDCGTVAPPVKILFTALPGTTAKLDLVDIPKNIQPQGGMLIDVDGADQNQTIAWNPKYYKLTTEDNYEYYLTDGIGITSIKDPNGNTLTYSDSGVTHSNGTAATFTRDASHRITAVTDPAGKQIRYVYNATGDLISVTDRNGAVSKMTYDTNHSLISYTDPNGKLAARFEYDADGRLIASYDANGKAIQMQHDMDNNQQTVTDRRGNKTTYTYDSNGNVTKVVNALNQVTTYTYDANGNQASVTNAANETTKTTFDPQSYKQTSETDPLGKTSTWDYDTNTRTQLKSSTDAKGNVTSYSYFEKGTRVDQPLGSYVHMGSEGGNLTSLTISDQLTRYQNDAKGNKISETDAAGKVTTYAYDSNGKEISHSWIATFMVNGVPTQKPVTVTRTLDAEGRVLSETDALGATTKTEYTPGGKISATIDPQGRRTSYSYDDTGKLTTTTYSDGKATTSAYDAGGNKVSETDRQGRTTRFEYDALNRLIRTTTADGTGASTAYDDAGRVASTTDAQGNTSINGYDAAGRLISLTDAKGKQTKYEYDNVGNRTKVTDATNKVTQFEYDALNRLVKTTYPDSSTSSTVWNTTGTKQSETDQAGNTTVYGYDPVGRLNQVTQTNAATQQQTVYGYDVNGNKTSQTDAQGHVTSWMYDANSRVISRTLPAGQTESFAYDVVANLTQKTDFAGKVTSYVYDVLGQVVQTNYPDGSSVSTTYTANGQVASTTISGGNNSNGRQNGQTTYTYDANDRLTKQVKPDGSFLAYAYDANGNISQRSTASGTVTYEYDKNQRLINVTNSATNSITTYTWDDAGRLATATTPDGVTANYSYDPNGRLLQLLHVKGSSVVAGSRYTLAANGQRTKVEEFDSQSTQTNLLAANPVRTTSYQYDGVNRLTQELVKDRAGTTTRTSDYVYDKVGNRSQKAETTATGTTTTAYAYDANDRLTQETKTAGTTSTVTAYTWDDKGNLSTKTTGGQVTVYGWNADNRLVEVKQGSSQATAITVARYSYDSNGNRVQKTESGQNTSPDKVTNYLVDETFDYAQTLQETVTQGAASESTSYVWGNGLIQQSRAGQLSYYHMDALGSTKVLTDSSGSVTDAYQYDAFGAVLNKTGTTANNYRYTGEYFDDAIALQYNRARWYDGNIGRFVTQDDYAGEAFRPQTLNKYAYAGADPVDNVDPSGQAYDSQSTSIANTVNGILASIGTAFSYSASIGGATLRYLGVAVENGVAQVLERRFGAELVRRGAIIMEGPGGRRVIDFLLNVGNRLTYIEVKYGLPRQAGAALTRLVGQMRTATNAVSGGKGSVILFTWAAPSEAQMALVVSALGETAGSVKIVSGLTNLIVYLNVLFGAI